MAAGESFKNRERFAIGTRVRPATKIDTGARGTVIEWDDDQYGVEFSTVTVRWDGQSTVTAHKAPFEIKRA